MKLTMLGTGCALVTNCYNTCFVLEDQGRCLLVDGGGGNGLLTQLEKAGISWKDLKEIYVTHKHLDHLLGIVWMVRMICQYMAQGEYEGEARIYAHREVIHLLRRISQDLIRKQDVRFLDERLHLIAVEDGECREVMGHRCTFFDMHSPKDLQYGFSMELSEGRRLVCCGDEPCNESGYSYVEGADWLLHEAYCLSSQEDIFHPYEKNHSTVGDACRLAQRLQVKNLLLYHTEEKNLSCRKELYLKEGKQFYSGNLYVPEDLEVLEL